MCSSNLAPSPPALASSVQGMPQWPPQTWSGSPVTVPATHDVATCSEVADVHQEDGIKLSSPGPASPLPAKGAGHAPKKMITWSMQPKNCSPT